MGSVMKFTYRSGQKPLDGFTVKRGVGFGGFGEVYFALSDGGKEVALKLIRGHSDVELRGIAQVLNFKHPHLVHLYDLKVDARVQLARVRGFLGLETDVPLKPLAKKVKDKSEPVVNPTLRRLLRPLRRPRRWRHRARRFRHR